MLNSSKQPENGYLKPYLRAANIHWGNILIDDINEMVFSENQLKRYHLLKGDLLVTEGGVTVGRSAIWNDELKECYYQNSINRVRPKKFALVKYLYYWIYFLKENGYIDLVADKATFGHLTKEKLERIPVIIPSLIEQNKLVDFMNEVSKVTEKAKYEINKLINKQREYRTALISAAVTGKIKVID